MSDFLPVSKLNMEQKGWQQCDFILVTGDAYVDHPSFAHAVISRVLENAGYKVGMIAQPDWHTPKDFKQLGRPRLAFLVAPGNMDSMVAHYTVSKRKRDKDAYSPAGIMGKRPDRATIVYCNRIREAYKNVSIIVGGIENSLRRFAHYDYWDDAVRRSYLIDSGADLLVYGMGESTLLQIAEALDGGLSIKDVTYINGTCFVADSLETVYEYDALDSFEKVKEDKVRYAKTFMRQLQEQDAVHGKRLVQTHGRQFVVQNPPQMPLSQKEMDAVYDLPYTRAVHPMYEPLGGVPAIEEVQFSLTSSRGCFGGCSFCALTFHQGRVVQGRSHESLIKEAKKIIEMPDFKGNIHDVGGPTANFRKPACALQEKGSACENRQCLVPTMCKNLEIDHQDYLNLLRKLRVLSGVKKVFVRSGLRFDYIMADKDKTFLKELLQYHTSGQLKVAPEHISERVLQKMGKPKKEVYDRFCHSFESINRQLGKEQYIVPYLMSGHPGSDLHAAVELAEYLRDIGQKPEQVQDFYPTPGALSTCMFHTGIDPRDMSSVYVPKSFKEKKMQRALLQYRKPENTSIVREALMACKREDLIGFSAKCLIKPKMMVNTNYQAKKKSVESVSGKQTHTQKRRKKK